MGPGGVDTVKANPGDLGDEEAVSYRIRGRVLILYLAVSFIASTVLVGAVWPTSLTESSPSPLLDALSGLVLYSLLLALLIRPVHQSGKSLSYLLGSRPQPPAMRWAITAGVAVLGIGVASAYAVYLPLSYAVPGFVEWWLLDPGFEVIWTQGAFYPLANLINLLVVVLIGPFVEEIFFRGLLLPSWAVRWGPTRAVVFSSLLFGVLHVDPLGGFLFGVVTAMVFLRTGSLWLPFIIHVTNNGLGWLLAAGEILLQGQRIETIAQFRESWWFGVVGASVGLPLLIALLRRIPQASAGR